LRKRKKERKERKKKKKTDLGPLVVGTISFHAKIKIQLSNLCRVVVVA
jgi:hypothetical protein